ncbi:hypothetical protein T484DRAFT_1803938, partial [Baffinella frigidus]
MRNSDIVVDKYKLDITVEKISCLRGTEWLNSELLGFFLEWWVERIGAGSETRMPKDWAKPKCYFTNTYFFMKLSGEGDKTATGYNYDAVKRWTRKVKVFECDKMIIPINANNTHWFMALIDMMKRTIEPFMALIDMINKTIETFDSMNGRHDKVHTNLLRYLEDEHKERKIEGVFNPAE